MSDWWQYWQKRLLVESSSWQWLGGRNSWCWSLVHSSVGSNLDWVGSNQEKGLEEIVEKIQTFITLHSCTPCTTLKAKNSEKNIWECMLIMNNNSCINNAYISIQRGHSGGNILLLRLTPVAGYNFKNALIVHNFHSQGSIPCRAAYHGVTGTYILNISFASYRVPIYTPGWRAAMWIKCLAEGQKVPGIDGNRTRNPLIQS